MTDERPALAPDILHAMTATDQPAPLAPWYSRRPQCLAITAMIVVACLGVMGAAIRYIADGTGALVPYLMLLTAPVLAIYYVWFLNFYEHPTEGA